MLGLKRLKPANTCCLWLRHSAKFVLAGITQNAADARLARTVPVYGDPRPAKVTGSCVNVHPAAVAARSKQLVLTATSCCEQHKLQSPDSR